jgi:hypothetical protein
MRAAHVLNPEQMHGMVIVVAVAVVVVGEWVSVY